MKSLRKSFLFALFFLLANTSLHADIKALSIKELQDYMKVGIKIIDIRKPEEIKKTGVIPTSYKLGFYDENGKINRAKWLHTFVDLVKNRQIKFVLISNNGEKAKLGANILADQKGYLNPYYLEGGIQHWIKKDKKIIKN